MLSGKPVSADGMTMSLGEASRLSGISEQSLRRHVKMGTLKPVFAACKPVRVTMAEFRRWLKWGEQNLSPTIYAAAIRQTAALHPFFAAFTPAGGMLHPHVKDRHRTVLSEKQFAAARGLARSAVAAERRRGLGPKAEKTDGYRWHYRLKDIDAWMFRQSLGDEPLPKVRVPAVSRHVLIPHALAACA